MFYFIYKGIGELEHVTESSEEARGAEQEGRRVHTCHDFGCLAEAQAAAYQATELTGDKYLRVDHGPGRHPRYDVVRAPKVGDEVSYGFNGDYYPCGVITRMSDSLRRIETNEGQVFWRRKETASWAYNRTWSMVRGHVDERNPSF